MNTSSISFSDIGKRVAGIAGTGYGRNLIGYIAQPILTNLRDIEQKKLEEDPEEKKPDPTPAEKLWQTLKENFAVGDLITAAGTLLLIVDSYVFSPDKDGHTSVIGQFFKGISLVMTFGGSLTAMLGRSMDLHRSVALGDDYAEFMLESAEKKGKKIFEIYSDQKKEQIKNEAKHLDRVLVYKDGVRESVLERFEQNEIGGIFDGPPGTGKTDGVKCIIGKWIERIEKEGFEAVVAELNLANFDDYLKEVKNEKGKVIEAIVAGSGLQINPEASFANNQGLMVLEILIRKIQKLSLKIEKHNQTTNAKKQKLAVFIDEFDKVFDPNTLQGCDKGRLKSLLIQFNELFVKKDLLLTGNLPLEEMIHRIKQHLYVDENNDGREVWEPLRDRLSSKNRVRVENPAALEQAEIIAGRLLERYRDQIDWDDFGLSGQNSGNFERDRRLLGLSIASNITSKFNQGLNGRQLKYTCDDIQGLLLGQARQQRASSPELQSISDSQWQSMTAIEKINSTRTKINRSIIEKAIKFKLDGIHNSTADNEKDLGLGIIKEYLNQDDVFKSIKDRTKLIKNGQQNLETFKILEAAYHKLSMTGKDVYVSKQPIKYGGKFYHHIIHKHDSDNLHMSKSDSEISISFVETEPQIPINSINPQNFRTTIKFPYRDLKLAVNPILNKANENQFSKLLDGVVKSISDKASDPALLKALIEGAAQSLST